MTTQSHSLSLPELSLYIHIPWCVKKCPYCDFNSHQSSIDDIPVDQYIEQLTQDLEADLPYVQGRSLHSVFIGGGTPSVFSADAIGRILESVRSHIAFAHDVEITMEANPGSVDNVHLRDVHQAGVNRLSIGVQSFNDQHLKRLGRVHDSHLAHAAIETALNAGFKRINLDLMHGLPEQTVKQALTDLEMAARYPIDHLSWYQLTLEPNTVFYSKPPPLPEENLLSSIYDRGHAYLVDQGYARYEVSAYARNDSCSRHNINYWTFGDYLGIGAGAHGKVTLSAEQEIIRTQKTRLPKDYLAAKFSAESETGRTSTSVPKDERAIEFFMNALRLSQGFRVDEFESRTAQSFDAWCAKFEILKDKGLLEDQQNRWTPTPLGARFLNSVLAELSD
ncbi:MAG: radical SAM family heme chaperone HemW [Pseudomonadota bacterium]